MMRSAFKSVLQRLLAAQIKKPRSPLFFSCYEKSEVFARWNSKCISHTFNVKTINMHGKSQVFLACFFLKLQSLQ